MRKSKEIIDFSCLEISQLLLGKLGLLLSESQPEEKIKLSDNSSAKI